MHVPCRKVTLKLLSPICEPNSRILYMEELTHKPSIDRLSIILAMVLLAYALTAFVNLPDRTISLQLPGFLFEYTFNFTTLVSLLVALMAAAGTDWLISSHPLAETNPRYHHWILPALTALSIGVPLDILPVSSAWWIIFTLGGFLFAAVLSAEYISVDPSDTRYPLAMIVLTAVSLALLLVLTIAVHGAGLRLYLVMLAVIPCSVLVNSRCLSLRSFGKWSLPWALVVGLIIGQFVVAFHYLPISPLQHGILITGIVYSLTSLISGLEEKQPSGTFWIEPAVAIGISLLLSILLG